MGTESEWSSTGRKVIARLDKLADPAARALACADSLEQLRTQIAAVYEVRLKAVAELRAQDLSYEKIGRLLGIHRARVAQMHKDIEARGLQQTRAQKRPPRNS